MQLSGDDLYQNHRRFRHVQRVKWPSAETLLTSHPLVSQPSFGGAVLDMFWIRFMNVFS